MHSIARAQGSGTFSHPSGTTKQQVFSLLSTAFEGFGRVVVEVDGSALTKNGNTCAIENSTDGGSTWVASPGQSQTANVAQHWRFDFAASTSIRAVLTSGTAEGATRNIPWRYTVY